MSFIGKILENAHQQVRDSNVIQNSLYVGDRVITVEDADNDSVFRVMITDGWTFPKVIRDVFATDLFDTIMKGVKQ